MLEIPITFIAGLSISILARSSSRPLYASTVFPMPIARANLYFPSKSKTQAANARLFKDSRLLPRGNASKGCILDPLQPFIG
jgi:hypothetical protein